MKKKYFYFEFLYKYSDCRELKGINATSRENYYCYARLLMQHCILFIACYTETFHVLLLYTFRAVFKFLVTSPRELLQRSVNCSKKLLCGLLNPIIFNTVKRRLDNSSLFVCYTNK